MFIFSDNHCTHITDIKDIKSAITVSEFSPCGSKLCVGLNSGKIYVFDADANYVKLKTILTDHESYVKDIKFSTSGKHMVTSAGLSMRIWDVTNDVTLKSTYYSPVNCATFVGDDIILAGEATGNLKMLTF